MGWYHLKYVAVTFVQLCLTEHPAQKYCAEVTTQPC